MGLIVFPTAYVWVLPLRQTLTAADIIKKPINGYHFGQCLSTSLESIYTTVAFSRLDFMKFSEPGRSSTK